MEEKKKKILIIDDSHDVLDLLELFMFNEFEVITTLNGFDGLKLAKERKPDCIITDIMMPGIDGIKLFNSLKKEDELKDIPVLAETSFTKKHSINSLLNMGFRKVITKPLNGKKILETIKEILNEEKDEENDETA